MAANSTSQSSRSARSRRPRRSARRKPLRTFKTPQPAKADSRPATPVTLPAAQVITSRAARQLWRHKPLFIAIIVIYGLLNLLLVQSLSGAGNVTSLKNELNQVFSGQFGGLVSGLTVFAALVGSAGNGSSNTAGAYQFFLVVFTSLALIWALRQTTAGSAVRVRDAYYQGMYPLIPFLIVLAVVGLELLPLIIGVNLYSIAVSNGIAVTSVEKLAWGASALLLCLLSLYLVSSSLMALYIVTLPDMTPLKALRSARELVRSRRWAVLRKLLFLPLVLLLAAVIIMLPIIIWLTPLASWVFFILTMLALAAAHGYLYNLYRALLHE